MTRWSCAWLIGPIFAVAQAGPPPVPPPGRMIDIGGWRLHLNCVGDARPSQPTVILEAGIGDFSVEWSLVQPSVAKFSRVCSYDRADEAWSDMGPHPRTMHQVVYELHTLLERAKESPPYVLVGHSYGGLTVRLYQSAYPSQVAGLVLVEPGEDDPLRLLPDRTLKRSSELVTGKAVPAVKTTDPMHLDDIPSDVQRQLTAVIRREASRVNEPPRNKLPEDAQNIRRWAYSQMKHWAQGDNPFEHEELAGLRAERAKSEYPLGDLPLTVITRGISDSEGPDAEMLEREHRQNHVTQAGMSRRGKLLVAEHSGHHVQLDEPQLVVKAIQGVVTASAGR